MNATILLSTKICYMQVELVLTVEEILRSIKLFRASFSTKYTKVHPNWKETWRQRIHYFFWGGEKYDTQDSVQKVISPQPVAN